MIKRKSILITTYLLILIFSDSNEAEKSVKVPTVIEGISVPNDQDIQRLVSEGRSVNFRESEDQIALESSLIGGQIAQKRDGLGHHHHHHSHQETDETAQFDSFSAPKAPNSQITYSNEPPPPPPPQTAVYDDVDEVLQSPAIGESYGSPKAPIVDGYGAPQAPIQNSYGSYKTSGVSAPPPPPPLSINHDENSNTHGPIPVPLPLPVKPGSIVIPHGPTYGPSKPHYKPRLPKRPSYRHPSSTQKRPSHSLPKPQFKSKPQFSISKPQYKPQKSQFKQRPKPHYSPGPKPAYKQPKRPSYSPSPSPLKYKTIPQQSRPKYKPAPQPPKPVYKPAPSQSFPSIANPISSNEVESWPKAQPEMPKIISLDVTCEKNLMKVHIEFDKPFYGIIFSKGHYSDVNCVHLPAGLGRTKANFDVSINSCGTTGNTENGLYGYGADSGSGTYFENTIVVQYDPQVQEVWDQARKLRCTWHDQYEKSVTFRPFAVDMLDVVRADFAGDNVGCWMQIQVGKGPWASEVSGLVKIGQTMTMVLAIKDDEQKFDMMVRNCMAHDGKRAPIQLVDQKGCVTRPKLMSKFTKIKNFGASASVLSYAHFQAFKFPDSMEVHFQCTIQICRYQCPDQCGNDVIEAPTSVKKDEYGSPQAPIQTTYSSSSNQYTIRSKRETVEEQKYESSDEEILKVNANDNVIIDLSDVGVEKVIQVVSSGDLTFAIKENEEIAQEFSPITQSLTDDQGYICMSTPAFAATLVILLAILVISCLLSAFLCLRHRSYYGDSSLIAAFSNPVFAHKKGHF